MNKLRLPIQATSDPPKAIGVTPEAYEILKRWKSETGLSIMSIATAMILFADKNTEIERG